MEQVFPGVYRDDGTLYTEHLVPGTTVYGESTRSVDGTVYRAWSADRSKAAAAITKGVRDFPVSRDDAVLYLGASTGTTVSHVSDIVSDGIVYAVEYAAKIARDLLQNTEGRDNVAPILGDARTPDEYAPLCSQVDVLYQDVAQQDQVGILQRNADLFLKRGGHAMIAIKAQSISSSRPPREVFDEAKASLRDTFEIVDGKTLSPFHEDHLFLVLRYPG